MNRVTYHVQLTAKRRHLHASPFLHIGYRGIIDSSKGGDENMVKSVVLFGRFEGSGDDGAQMYTRSVLRRGFGRKDQHVQHSDDGNKHAKTSASMSLGLRLNRSARETYSSRSSSLAQIPQM